MATSAFNVFLVLILLGLVVTVVVLRLEPFIRRRYPTPEGQKPLPLNAIVLPILFGAIVGGAMVNFLAKPDRRRNSDGIDGFDGLSGSDASDSGSSGGDSGGGGGDGG